MKDIKSETHETPGAAGAAAAAPNFTRAYLLLESPDRWTTGASARDAAGKMVQPSGLSAVCWDISGALQKVYGWAAGGRMADAVEALVGEVLVVWNDKVKHEDVYAILREMDL